MRDKYCASEAYLVSVVQDAIDLYRGVAVRRISEVLCSSALDRRHITVHHHIFCTGKTLYLRASGVVVGVGVTDKQNFYIAKVETQLFNALFDERRRTLKARVD